MSSNIYWKEENKATDIGFWAQMKVDANGEIDYFCREKRGEGDDGGERQEDFW